MMSNKVLIHILEDNPLVTFLLERTIRNNFDSKIKCFTSSHEFEHSLNTQKPDLLILDYYLGPLKNQETVLPTIEKLKKKNVFIPIIVFSSLSDANKIETLKNLGIHHIISKNSDDFLNEIVRTIESSIRWTNMICNNK